VGVLLAGTIPVMTFVVERRISHRYIAPALAAEDDHLTAPGGARQASPGAAAGREAAPPAAHTPGTPSHPAE
jgi:hypothetical protein